MKRWKAAAVLALCTVLLLRLTQVQAHPVGESPYVPALGIVTTAACLAARILRGYGMSLTFRQVVHWWTSRAMRRRRMFRISWTAISEGLRHRMCRACCIGIIC